MDKAGDLGEQKKAEPWGRGRWTMEPVDEEELEIFSEEPPFMKQRILLEVLMERRMMDPLKRRQEEEEALRFIFNGPPLPNAPFPFPKS